MKESAADIQKYLDILQGNLRQPKKQINEHKIVDLGVATGGVEVGQTYTFDNGVRWANILNEENEHWLIEYGFIEHSADSQEYISKHDMAVMVGRGEMILHEKEDVLLENDEKNSGFEIFMERVNRYLLLNYDSESDNFSFDWNKAYESGLSPHEAADEAYILKG